MGPSQTLRCIIWKYKEPSLRLRCPTSRFREASWDQSICSHPSPTKITTHNIRDYRARKKIKDEITLSTPSHHHLLKKTPHLSTLNAYQDQTLPSNHSSEKAQEASNSKMSSNLTQKRKIIITLLWRVVTQIEESCLWGGSQWSPNFTILRIGWAKPVSSPTWPQSAQRAGAYLTCRQLTESRASLHFKMVKCSRCFCYRFTLVG